MKTLFRILTLAALVTLPAVSFAWVMGSEFDDLPAGPYGGAGQVQGDPSRVQVVPVGDLGGATPPGAVGNVLVIDNRDGEGPIIVTFAYTCGGPTEMDICAVEYGFYYEAWTIEASIGVYVDAEGNYDNPDDLFDPPVGFPPSTSFGDNTEREQDCVGIHTISFVVNPGAVAVLDNFETECLEPVANENIEWDSLKSCYR